MGSRILLIQSLDPISRSEAIHGWIYFDESFRDVFMGINRSIAATTTSSHSRVFFTNYFPSPCSHCRSLYRMNSHGSSVGATRNRGGIPADKTTPNVYYHHHALEPQATTIEQHQQARLHSQQRQTNCNNFGEQPEHCSRRRVGRQRVPFIPLIIFHDYYPGV
jgi:hypothetical protein